MNRKWGGRNGRYELDFSMASVTPQSRGKNECSSFEGGVLCEKYLKEFVKEVKNCD